MSSFTQSEEMCSAAFILYFLSR